MESDAWHAAEFCGARQLFPELATAAVAAASVRLPESVGVSPAPLPASWIWQVSVHPDWQFGDLYSALACSMQQMTAVPNPDDPESNEQIPHRAWTERLLGRARESHPVPNNVVVQADDLVVMQRFCSALKGRIQIRLFFADRHRTAELAPLLIQSYMASAAAASSTALPSIHEICLFVHVDEQAARVYTPLCFRMSSTQVWTVWPDVQLENDHDLRKREMQCLNSEFVLRHQA